MTDVLKLALGRRSELQEELVKLDEFIRMAESLMTQGEKAYVPRVDQHVAPPVRPSRVTGTSEEPDRRRITAKEAAATPSRPQVMRRGQTTSAMG